MNLAKRMKKATLYLVLIFISFNCFSQLVPYRVKDKWGYSDDSGKIVIEPQYSLADFFENGIAFVQKDSLYFGINTNGEILTEGYLQYGRFNSGLCPVTTRGKKSYYINATGKNAFNKVFTAAENFSEGLAVVSMKNKCGIINTSGSWVREPDFDSSSLFFKSGFLIAKSHSKFVYIDKRGKDLVLPENIKPAGIFSDGLAAVYVVKKTIENNTEHTAYNLAFIDSTGSIALSSFINEGLDYAGYLNYEKEFIDGKAIINVPNQMASDRYFIDKKGKFSHVFSYAQHLNDSMFLGVIGYMLPTVRIYDSSFNVMGDFSMVLSTIGTFGNGLLPVQNKAGYWGYCNDNARLVIPFIYQSADKFNNGYAVVKSAGRFGVINTKGKEFFREEW